MGLMPGSAAHCAAEGNNIGTDLNAGGSAGKL
jgi:hypothetical protein